MDFSDDVKSEAIDRLSNGKDFIMSDGNLATIIFPNNPEQMPIPPAQIEAMCERVKKEWDLEAKYAPPAKPTVEQQLEYLWHDLNNNSLNKGGTFYNMMRPYLDK